MLTHCILIDTNMLITFKRRMVSKLKSRTVLRCLIFTRPLLWHGLSKCLSNWPI